MGSKFTKNQKLWQDLTSDVMKRLDNLNKHNIKSNVFIPPTPATITQKQIKRLMKTQAELKEIETTMLSQENIELKARKRKGEAIDEKVVGARGVGVHRGNPNNLKGHVNSSNLTHTGGSKGYKPYVVETILGRYSQRIAESGVPIAQDILSEFFDDMCEHMGEHAFAQMLYENAQNGLHLTNEVLYDSTGEKARKYVASIIQFAQDPEIYNKFQKYLPDIEEATDMWEDID